MRYCGGAIALSFILLCLTTSAYGEVVYPIVNYAPGSYSDRVFACCKPRHLGEDIKAEPLTPIYAFDDGQILPAPISGPHTCFGMVVVIEHILPDNAKIVSLYGHLSNRDGYKPKLNGPVKGGEVIGYVAHSGGLPPSGKKVLCGAWPDDENGDGGSHLHFGIRKGAPPTSSQGNYLWVYYGYAGNGEDVDYDLQGNFIGGKFTKPSQLIATLQNLDSDDDDDGYTISQGDCNDNNSTTYPSAKEKCDSQDNDCDGLTDEDFKKGMAQDLGNPCTVGFGVCQNQGQMVCTKDSKATVCSVDAKLVQQAEICDGLDNDCDGETDEGFDLGMPCTVGVGECQATGIVVCATEIGKAVCSKAPLPPQSEKCDDAKDSNCDGTVGEWKPEATILEIIDQGWNLSFLHLRFNPATNTFGLLRNEADIRFHEINKKGQVLSSKILVTDVSINLYVGFELINSGYVLTWQDKNTENIWWMVIDHHGEIIATQILVNIPYGCSVYSVSLGYNPTNNSYGFAWHFSGSPANGCQDNLFTVMHANGEVVLPPMSIQSLPQDCCYTTGPVLVKDNNFVTLFGKGYGTYFTEVDITGQTISQFYVEVNGDVMFFNEFNIVWTGQFYGAFFGDFFEFDAQGNQISSFNASDDFAIWQLPHLIWNGSEYATTATTSKYVPGWGNKNTGILFGRLSGKQWLTPLVYLTEDEGVKEPSVAWDGEQYAIVWNKASSILMRFVSCK